MIDLAKRLHDMARIYEEAADIARAHAQSHDEATQRIAGWGWHRFAELSKKGQALAMETAQCLDALAAEASTLADRVESELG